MMHGHPANSLDACVLENRVFAERIVKIFTDGQDTVVSTSTKVFSDLHALRLASGHLKVCTNVAGVVAEMAAKTQETTEAAKARAATTSALAQHRLRRLQNAKTTTKTAVAAKNP